jgi:uncharacterized protein (DUF2267 family)
MGYRELIKKIQHDSGFSDVESQEALDLMVESIAERLEEDERMDFASQLPAELQALAIEAEMPSKHERHEDIIKEFMEKEGIDEGRAKKQVLTAWKALKSTISEGEIRHIRAQLPDRIAATLY